MINQNWVFGKYAGLDFSTATATNPPTARTGFAIDTSEGCASISDSHGDLLFYTDGTTIWDKHHTPKVTGLLGDSSSTQSAIIVPDPGDKNQYYIFTMDGSSNPTPPFNHFNGGLLNVTSWVFTPLLNLMTLPNTQGFSPAEKLTAVQHENCKDFWVITVLQKGTGGSEVGTGKNDGIGTFRVFKVDATGVSHVADTLMNQLIYEYGYLKCSPDGKNLAIANGTHENILVYPFDNATGAINIQGLREITVPSTIPITLTNPVPLSGKDTYGVEFSPNSQVLYYATLTRGSGHVFQVDLSITTLASIHLRGFSTTKTEVYEKTTYTAYAIGALQLGMDGRIYIAKYLENTLGAILNPNVLGAGCNLNPSYITLAKGNVCKLGLPNLLPNPCEDDCDCDCDCGCEGCNEKGAAQNQELLERAKVKTHIVSAQPKDRHTPFTHLPCTAAIDGRSALKPNFYLHWGDSAHDVIENHDNEILYISACNPFSDIVFKGLRITKVSFDPSPSKSYQARIVPDMFISYDCLAPCTCKTREFSLTTRDEENLFVGNKNIVIEYCIDEVIVLSNKGWSGKALLPITIIKDEE
jgi:hypothetical protein